VNGGYRLLPLLLVALFLAALAGGLAGLSGPRAYLPRLLLLISAIAFLTFLYRGRREIAFLLLQVRRSAEPGPAATWLLASVVLLVGSVLLSRTPVRLDATGRGMNRLSAVSRAVLASGGEPLEMIGVYRENSPLRDRAVDLLEIYRTSSSRIQVRMIDPDRRPEEARALGLTRVGLVVLRSGPVREEVDQLTEEEMTQAILRVEHPARTRILFVTGHGEAPIGDGGPSGLGRFAAALRQSGYDVGEIRLFADAIAPEVAALVAVGPEREFLPGEIEKLVHYLDGGGRLLLCLEPGADGGLWSLLRTRGIALDSLEVFDESPSTRGLAMGPRTVVVTDYAQHPILGGGSGYTVFSGARAVTLTNDAVWGVDAQTLFRTGPQARGTPVGAETPSNGGPVSSIPLAVVEEWEVPATGNAAPGEPTPEKPYARMLVVGDADWLEGRFIDLYANRDLGLRSIHWLARREFLLRIPQMDVRGTPLRIGFAGMRTLFYLLQVGVPLALLGVGLWVWTRRR
jgi:ABC-type uncharacterized transport system involved in gliding motility auxiliary subunit